MKHYILFLILLSTRIAFADGPAELRDVARMKELSRLSDDVPDSIQPSLNDWGLLNTCLGISESIYLGGIGRAILPYVTANNSSQEDFIDLLRTMKDNLDNGVSELICVDKGCIYCPNNDFPFTCLPPEAGACT